jgi:hypothetical protein
MNKDELLRMVSVLESDLFKVRAENMRFLTQIKDFEEKSILNKKVYKFSVRILMFII